MNKQLKHENAFRCLATDKQPVVQYTQYVLFEMDCINSTTFIHIYKFTIYSCVYTERLKKSLVREQACRTGAVK